MINLSSRSVFNSSLRFLPICCCMYVCMHVCMYVCIFIKLHITAQSGLVILVILCHSRSSSQGGINDTCYENLWSNATKGTHSLYLYKSYLSPEHLVLPPLLPCCSLGYPGWQLLNQPFLFYIFFAFHPCLPRFPRGVYRHFAGFCAFSPPFRPPQSYVCVYVCMYVCMYVFIKLHITTQSGPVILVILCHSH